MNKKSSTVPSSFLTFLSNMLTNLNLTDIETGYKAFRKEILKKITIEEKRFGIEPEITAKIAKLNCRIFEVGISYYGRTYKQGKKINWKDGISAIRCIIKYNICGPKAGGPLCTCFGCHRKGKYKNLPYVCILCIWSI